MIAMVVMQGRCRRDLRHVRWRAHALVLLDCAVMQVEKSDTPSPGDRSGSIDDQLGALRRDIDSVDRQIVELLNRRASLAQHVGEVKKLVDAPVYRPEREAQIFAKLNAINTGPLPSAGIVAVYREIISACRELERRMRVAYLGPAGTFSEQALLKHFGSSVDPIPCVSIDEVFRATESGTADFGVVPVENSSEGAVNRSLDLLLQTTLPICGEVSIAVRHNLMSSTAPSTASRGCAPIRRRWRSVSPGSIATSPGWNACPCRATPKAHVLHRSSRTRRPSQATSRRRATV